MSPIAVSASSAGPNLGPAITTRPPPNSSTNSRVISQNRLERAAAGMSPRKRTSVAKKSARDAAGVARKSSFEARTCVSAERRNVRKPRSPTSGSRWKTSFTNRHSQVGSYSTYSSRRKSSRTSVSRVAWLSASIDSPSIRSTVATTSWRPIVVGVNGNSTATVPAESGTDRVPTTIGAAFAVAAVLPAGMSSSRTETVTSATASSSPDCRSVTATVDRSSCFITGGGCTSIATFAARVGPTPTQ